MTAAPETPSPHSVIPSPALLIDAATAADLLTLETCIGAVEDAFRRHAQGRSLAPALLHVDAGDGEFHVKAGGLHGDPGYFACKINAGFFSNRRRFGLPNIVGLIVLGDARTGVPLAVMDAGVVTRLRTGAATAVAARYLARPDSRTVTVCGGGTQARIQLEALKHALPLERAFLWSRSDTSALAAELAGRLQLDVRPASSLDEVAPASDVIITCTPARHGFLERRHVSPGTFVAAVGADSPDKQELEPSLVAAARVVCDIVEQCAHVGELHHALEAGLMTRQQVHGSLGEVIAGRIPGRTEATTTFVFDSTGTALQDVAAAAAVYERARASGRGETFAFWS